MCRDGRSAPTTSMATGRLDLVVPPRHMLHVHDLSVLLREWRWHVIALLAPNGGERVFATRPTTIRWTVSGASSVDVELSRNGGTTYVAIPGCTGLAGSATSCIWTPASPATSTARIRVTARGGSGLPVTDASDANFTISTATPSITVTIAEHGGPLERRLDAHDPVESQPRARLVRAHRAVAQRRWYLGERRADGLERRGGVPARSRGRSPVR